MAGLDVEQRDSLCLNPYLEIWITSAYLFRPLQFCQFYPHCGARTRFPKKVQLMISTLEQLFFMRYKSSSTNKTIVV